MQAQNEKQKRAAPPLPRFIVVEDRKGGTAFAQLAVAEVDREFLPFENPSTIEDTNIVRLYWVTDSLPVNHLDADSAYKRAIKQAEEYAFRLNCLRSKLDWQAEVAREWDEAR